MSDKSDLIEQPRTRDDLLKLMLVAAAGRAGEVVYGNGANTSTSGVSQDFDMLRELAREYVESGMGNGTYTSRISTAGSERERGNVTDQIDIIADTALHTALDLMHLIGQEKMASVVEDLGTTPRVLLGKEASTYVRSAFNGDFAQLKGRLQTFLDTPMGEKLAA